MLKSGLLFRLYVAFLTAVLVISTNIAGASVGSLDTPNIDTPYDSPTSTITLEFPSPAQVMVMAHETEYHWLKLPGCRYVLEPGHPSLPIKVTTIKINEGYNVSAIWAGVISTDKLEGKYKIMPAPEPVHLGEGGIGNLTAPMPQIYEREEMYPYNWFDYRVYHGIDPETLTTVRYLAVYFYPLRYIPVKGEIIRATGAELYVEYSGSAQGQKSPSTSLIIITSPLLEPQATLLADWKNRTGISTRVVTTSWIYANYPGIDEPEKIRNYIKHAKASLGVTFVLIFGDADQVPVRYAWIPDGFDDGGDMDGSVVETDLYYADLDYTWDDNHDGKWGDIPNDQVDGLPDLYIGRLPASNENDASTLIKKIKNHKPTVDWFNRYLLMGGDPFTGDSGAEGEILKNYIKDNFIPPFLTCNRLYESLGNYTVSDARREIDEGYGVVNFDGHGDYNKWWFGGGGTYYKLDAMAQVNGNKTSAIFVMACLTSRFSDRDCIGEAFLLNPNGGAIAYYGASRVAWGYVGWSAPNGLAGEMDWRFFEAIYDSYDQPLDLSTGQILGTALTRYVLNHPPDTYYVGNGYLDWKTAAEYGALLGDPTVYLYAPLPEHDIAVTKLSLPSSAPPSETITISAQVQNYGLSDEYGIEIQLLVNGDPFDIAYIAELPSMAGTTVSFTWTPLTCGIHNITIHALIEDENPANNAASATVHIHSLFVDSIDAPRDVPEEEVFTLLVGVSNHGSETISEAYATIILPSGLSTGDPLTKPIKDGSIPPGESGEVDWKVNADVEGEYTLVVAATSFNGGFDMGSTMVKVRGGCFIFTAAYGSPMASQVRFMRSFRDDVASQTSIGRGFFNIFNRIYFSFSPQLASFISSREWIRGATRVFVTPAVKVVCVVSGAYGSVANVLGSELAILIALFTIVTLSGIIYFSPIVILFLYIRKTYINRRLGRVKIG